MISLCKRRCQTRVELLVTMDKIRISMMEHSLGQLEIRGVRRDGMVMPGLENHCVAETRGSRRKSRRSLYPHIMTDNSSVKNNLAEKEKKIQASPKNALVNTRVTHAMLLRNHQRVRAILRPAMHMTLNQCYRISLAWASQGMCPRHRLRHSICLER